MAHRSSSQHSGRTGWWQAFFIDHLLRGQKHDDAKTNPASRSHDKWKMWCRKCWDGDFQAEVQRDEAEITAGQRNPDSARSEQQITDDSMYIFT